MLRRAKRPVVLAMCAVVTLALLGPVTAPAAAAGPNWTGTVSTSWDWTSSSEADGTPWGSQRDTGSARYEDLMLIGGDSYSANVTLSGTQYVEIDTGENQCTMEQPVAFTGRSDGRNDGESGVALEIEFRQSDGRVWLTPHNLPAAGTYKMTCTDGHTDSGYQNNYMGSFLSDTWAAPLTADTDPDPDRLVGQQQWELPNLPAGIEPGDSLVSYTYTVTYDLRRAAGVAFTWKVAEQSPDADGDGQLYRFTDGMWSRPLPEHKKFNVTLNGCANGTGTEFTVDGQALNAGCNPRVLLAEGPHTVKAVAPNGASTTETIYVVHHLVVGLGDSFGSGETEGDYDDWDDPNCRRATWSAQARAAVALEKTSPHSTVTFLHLACSGATVKKGLLAPYGQMKDGECKGCPPGAASGALPVKKSQVRQAADLTVAQGWDIDAVLLSIGGNDINFSPTLKTCAAYKNCPLTKLRFPVKSSNTSLHAETMRRLKRLPAKYRRVARCLTGYSEQTGNCDATDWNRIGSLRVGASDKSSGGDPAKVLLSEYPDLSTKIGDSGMKSPDGYRYCNNALKGLAGLGGGHGKGIADEEFAWAQQVVQKGRAGTQFTYRKDISDGGDVNVKLDVTANGLNQVINAGPSGWTPVTGAFKAFAGHGYCAGDDRWVTTMSVTYLRSHNMTAPFHPNKRGYKAWGTIIARSLITKLNG